VEAPQSFKRSLRRALSGASAELYAELRAELRAELLLRFSRAPCGAPPKPYSAELL